MSDSVLSWLKLTSFDQFRVYSFSMIHKLTQKPLDLLDLFWWRVALWCKSKTIRSIKSRRAQRNMLSFTKSQSLGEYNPDHLSKCETNTNHLNSIHFTRYLPQRWVMRGSLCPGRAHHLPCREKPLSSTHHNLERATLGQRGWAQRRHSLDMKNQGRLRMGSCWPWVLRHGYQPFWLLVD